MNRELTYNNGIAMFWKSVDILKHCIPTHRNTHINKREGEMVAERQVSMKKNYLTH